MEPIQTNTCQTPPLTIVQKTRSQFAVFGTISLLLGIAFTICFFRAGIGISYPIFVIVAIALIHKAGHYLMLIASLDAPASVSKISICYDIIAVLLAVSNVFTASALLWFFSTVFIILLLELSLLQNLFADFTTTFIKQIGHVLLLPLLSIGQIAYPVIDSCSFFKKNGIIKKDKSRQILLGVVIAIPILLLVIALLSSADLIFSDFIGAIGKVLISDPLFILILTLVIFGLSYCLVLAAANLMEIDLNNRALMASRASSQSADNSITAVTVVILLTLIYLVFCFIQIRFLFQGESISLPENYSYAEYARQGFFELLTVTILNFLIVLCCLKSAEKNGLLRIVLTIMTACTYIMMVSAGMRMLLYISVYHLTFLRILVLWFLGVNTLLMTGTLITIWKKEFPLFSYCIIAVSVCYLGLAFFRPDTIIAKYNIEHDTSMTKSEVRYLTELSIDSAPYVVPLLDEWSEWNENEQNMSSDYLLSIKEQYCDKVKNSFESRGIRDFNFSCKQAKDALFK